MRVYRSRSSSSGFVSVDVGSGATTNAATTTTSSRFRGFLNKVIPPSRDNEDRRKVYMRMARLGLSISVLAVFVVFLSRTFLPSPVSELQEENYQRDTTSPASFTTLPASFTTRSTEVSSSKLLSSERSVESQAAESNNEFGVKLLQALVDWKKGENIIFSPFSISVALATTLAGARGRTAQELQRALQLPLRTAEASAYDSATFVAQLAAAIQTDLIPEEVSSEELASGESEGKFAAIQLANALWGGQDVEFHQDFLSVLEGQFSSAVRNTNFGSKTAAQEINNWVAEKTQGKITDILAEGLVNHNTRLVLANAIHFKGSWFKAFEETNTAPADFFVTESEVLHDIPLMHRIDKLLYHADPASGYKAVKIPYKGDQASMVLVLPPRLDSTSTSDPSFQLTAAQLNDIQRSWTQKTVDLFLPKFKLTSSFDDSLIEALRALGLGNIFGASADFSGMAKERLQVGAVVHKAFIEVDEKGTEAAAATMVIMMRALAVQPITEELVVLRFDRPFDFYIVSEQTKAILFAGKVVRPS